MKILVDAPLNSLSLGNVSYNIIRELIDKGHDVGIFPVSGKVDLSAYNVPEYLVSKINSGIENRFDYLSKDIPSLKIWHLNGSEERKNPNQYLYTFYECNKPTEIEKKICNAQTQTIFSSKYAGDQFGCPSIPLGFDKDFFNTKKQYLQNVIHFGLMGKFEKRKHTGEIINAWAKKYGNDNKYQLTCCVTNPFFDQEEMSHIINSSLEGKRYSNINFLPYLKKNEEVNDLLNAIDIDLTGLSGAEGWNLPSFNATCLGKWSVVLNATSHKDWASKENCVLVEPSSEIKSHDGKFFIDGSKFNQGTFYSVTEEEMISAMEEAEKKVGQTNTEGQKLADNFTYSKTVDSILSLIS